MSNTSSPSSATSQTATLRVQDWLDECYLVMAPAKVRAFERFNITIGSDVVPNDGENLLVRRRLCQLNPVDGPIRIEYTNGSYLFKDLIFTGDENHYRDWCIVHFDLFNNRDWVASCTVTIGLDLSPE